VNKKSVIITVIASVLAVIILVRSITSSGASSGGTPPAFTPTPAQGLSTSPKFGGILRVNVSGPDPYGPGWPPLQIPTYDTFNSRPVVEALGRFDAKGVPQPYLAESWSTDIAGKSVTVKLKKGIKFTDSTDFNAAAVKWNLEQFLNAKRSEFPRTNSIDIIDDYTLKITMVQWDNTILSALCLYPSSLISPTAWRNARGASDDKARNDWATSNPVGTGAFTLVEWQKGTRYLYKKNQNYWQKNKPYLDSIEITFSQDNSSLLASFQDRNTDVWFLPSLSSAKTLADLKYPVAVSPKSTGNGQYWLIPNSSNTASPFANVRVRQALSTVIRGQDICSGALESYAITSNQFAVPGTPWYNNDLKGYPYDPENAKKILAQAGYANGIKAKILIASTTTYTSVAAALKEMLARANISIEIESDLNLYSKAMTSSWDSLLLASIQLSADPLIAWSRTLKSGGSLWATGIMHPSSLDNAIDEAWIAATMEAKQSAIRKAQVVLFDQFCLATPIAIVTPPVARQQYVKSDGIMETDMWVWSPENAWLDK
jgi:peptide/nickel transport system substrate-binding protein